MWSVLEALAVFICLLLLLCVQLNVKLFVFDNKTQSWLERGLGLLRLNDRCLPSDSETFQSRLGQFTTHLCLSVCLPSDSRLFPVHFTSVCLSIYLSAYLLCLFVCASNMGTRSLWLSVCLSISLCLYVCLCVCASNAGARQPACGAQYNDLAWHACWAKQ